jgi:hypothetical protein
LPVVPGVAGGGAGGRMVADQTVIESKTCGK